jgi:hypothetical protein
MENLTIGIISGLVVTALVVLLRAIWNSVIVPWFENKIYKDVRIEGAWFSLYPTTAPDYRRDVISLTRRGHEVSGLMICTDSGADKGVRYKISGSFRNMILPLVYEDESKSSTDRGTITLKVTEGGKQMKGKVALYENKSDSIDEWDVIWFRDQAKLDEYVELLEGRRKMIVEYKEKQKEMEKISREVTDTSASEDEKSERKKVDQGDAVNSEAAPLRD